LSFEHYQLLASRTFNRKLSKRDLIAEAAMGLGGEAGETLEVIKKHLYHGRELDLEALEAELGDVLWYLSALASHLGLSLEDVARNNIEKLERRHPDGFSEASSLARVDAAETELSAIDALRQSDGDELAEFAVVWLEARGLTVGQATPDVIDMVRRIWPRDRRR
jgi:NTP pyrophosphatase (non-canonical NTP hydrolase)